MKNKIKVLLITVRADHGGGPKHIELLLRHFPDLVEPHVACPEEPPYRDRFDLLTDGRIRTIPHRRFDLPSAFGLALYARREKIDVIHAHGKGAGVYARALSFFNNALCVHTPHGVHVGKYGPVSRFLYRAYENVTARWVDHVIFVSQEERDVAKTERLWSRVPSSVIVNGVETVDVSFKTRLRSNMRRSLSVKEDCMVVVTLSRFDYQKNMHEAYKIAKSMPSCLFLWIGDGEDRRELERKAKSDNLSNLRFLGNMDDPSPYLAAADVYFSSSRWEGLPLGVLEAMAMGLPIVASEVKGHCEVVEESGAGLLYPLGDSTQAMRLLTKLSDDVVLRAELGTRALSVQQEKYSAQRMADAVCSLYECLINRGAD
jgi:glycosyltransferase involved in cell wall biosynthesis